MQAQSAIATDATLLLDVIPSALASLSDGSIVIATWQGVVRLARDGSAIAIGDPPSIVPLPIAPIVTPRALAIDARDRILVAGASREETIVLRLLPEGVPDASFGDRGVVRLDAARVRTIEVDSEHTVLLGDAGAAPLVVRLAEDGARVTRSGMRPATPSSRKPSSDHCPILLADGTVVIACRHDFEREGTVTPYAAELAAIVVDSTGLASPVRRVARDLHVIQITDACALDDGSVIVGERTLAGLRVTKLAPRHDAVDSEYGNGGHVHVFRSSDEEITWGPVIRPVGPNRFALAWSFARALTGQEHTMVAILDARTGRRSKSYAQVGLRATALAVSREGGLLVAGASSQAGKPGRIEIVTE